MSGASDSGRPAVLLGIPRRGHLVVEASAGTGKTFLLEHLYVDRLVAGARFEEVLVVTFTEKAAREMRERIRARLGQTLAAREDAPGEGWALDEAAAERLREALGGLDRAPISTIHAFCLRVLRERPLEAGLPVTLQQVESGSLVRRAALQALRRALGGHGPASAHRDVLASWAAEDLEGLLSRLTAWYRSEGEARCPPMGAALQARFEALRALRAELSDRIAEERAMGRVDFDAMIALVADALARQPSPLLQRLQQRFRHGLVDEFQDTSPAQWRIFEAIFLRRPPEDGATLAIIGDPKQAIYGFRGGDLFTYLRARGELLARHRAGRHVLARTYRAGAPLAELFDRFFGTDAEGDRPDFFRLPAVRYVPVRSGRPERVLLGPDGQPLPPLHLLVVGQPPEVPKVGKEDARAAASSAMVALLRSWFVGPSAATPWLGEAAETAEAPARRLRPLRPQDVFVLCRQHDEAEEIVEALRAAGVPAVLYKQRGLFEGEAARQLRTLLGALLEPDDPGRRLAAYGTVYFALSLEELGRAAAQEEAGDGPPPERLERLRRWAWLARQRRWPELVARWEEAGLAERQLALAPSERLLANARALHEMVLRWGTHGAGTAEILARLEALARGERLDGEREEGLERLPAETRAVQVMTIHASKGLEAEVVFVQGALADRKSHALEPLVVALPGDPAPRRGLVPCVPRDGGQQVIISMGGAEHPPSEPATAEQARHAAGAEREREERRLAYVAVTRARRMVVLPYFAQDEALLKALSSAGGADPPSLGPLKNGHGKAPLPFSSVLFERLDELAADPGFLAEHGRLWRRSLHPVRAEASPRRPWQDDETRRFEPLREALGTPTAAGEPASIAKREAAARLAAPLSSLSFTAVQRAASHAPPTLPLVTRSEDDEEEAPASSAEREDLWLDVAELGPEEAAPSPPTPGRAPNEAPSRGEDAEAPALPGGRATGILLHEALERIPLGSFLAHEDFETWWEAEGRAVLRAVGGKQFDKAVLEAAGRLLHEALRCPVELPGGQRLERGLCELETAPRAVERTFRLWTARRQGGPLLVEGAIDLLFEWDGRLYVLDWKSNWLPAFDRAAVASLIEEHYALQVALYTLGLSQSCDWLDDEGQVASAAFEARFGGVLYAFLRGMAAGEPAACWAWRPSAAALSRWWRMLGSSPPERWLREAAEPLSEGAS